MSSRNKSYKRKIVEITAGTPIELSSFELENKNIFRLWTIFSMNQFNPNNLELEQVPVIHHQGVFLEDINHDWFVKKGVLHYFSRVVAVGSNVQLLLEFED